MKRQSVALFLETSSGYSRGLLRGITAYVRDCANWSVVLIEVERGSLPPNWLRTWNGDGIIARIETRNVAEFFRGIQIPLIDLSETRYVKEAVWSQTDDAAIAALAAAHFIERRYGNIAFCGDPGFAWSRNRQERFADVVGTEGFQYFAFEATHRYADGFSWDDESNRMREWLQRLPKPVGIFCCYDFLARQVLDVCLNSKLRVPEAVAVLGVDDDALICELADPPLSSVTLDTHAAGYRAAELLHEIMRSGDADSKINKQANKLGRQTREIGAGTDVPSTLEAPLVVRPLGVRLRESTDTVAIPDAEVAKALTFIRENATSNIFIEDVLASTSLSRRVFEYRFKKFVGRSPHDEIQRLRLNLAKRLLAGGNLPVGEIARRAGFKHGEYLTSVFRRSQGMTPTQFRRVMNRESSIRD